MSLPSYLKYKDSGVEWLGRVPEHWHVGRLKNSIHSSKGGIWGGDASFDTNDIACVRVADFDRAKLRVALENPTIRNILPSERNGRILERGDLLLEKSGGGESQPVGCVVMYEDDEQAVCSNFVTRLTPAADMAPEYWCYVHFALYALRINYCSINQTSGIQNLDQDKYLNELVPFPDFWEQSAIVEFLNRETSKIDSLISQQEKLITLLAEKLQATISRAVTSGLSPDAQMKDSGVAWLGEVPEHWTVAPLGYRYNVQLGKMLDNAKATGQNLRSYLRVFDVQWGVINSDNLPKMDFSEDDRRKFRLKSGDLLVNEGGSYPGRSAIWYGTEDQECYYQKALHRLRVRRPSEA